MTKLPPTADIVLYSTALCPYRTMAKRLLSAKGVRFKEIRVDRNLPLREEMTARSRRFTVPQIFIAEQHVGGFDDLYELDRTGKLDALLQST